MNILYLTNHLNIGGITSYVFSLATGLKKRGHNIYIASSAGELLPRFIQEGIVYIAIPIKTKSEISPKIILSLFKLLGLVKQNSIDIVHSNSRTTQVLGSLLSRLTNMVHIYTCHGFFKKRLSRRLFGCWGNRVIAISEAVKEHLLKDFGVKEEAISVIYNGIDVEKFKSPTLRGFDGLSTESLSEVDKIETKKKMGLGDGQVIGIVARLSEEKGHIYLIEAMRAVLGQIPQAQLLIVGQGRMKQKLVNLSKNLGMEKNVFFMPEVYDKQEVLSIMDLFVLPSLKEGLGLSLMEAMASGLAVIGSDIGGIRSLIQDGYNGILVKPADSKGLSRVIIELLQDSRKARVLGNNAQIFIGQNFSNEKMVLQTERLYQECLSSRD